MCKENDHNLNVTLKAETAADKDVIVSFHTLFNKIKRVFLLWLLISFIVGTLIIGLSIFSASSPKTPLSAVIGFSYNGIEKGKSPDGSDFDTDTLSSPKGITAALNERQMDMNLLEPIRQGISIEGIIPNNAADRIIAYKNVYESFSANSLNAAEKMLNTTYHPTQFRLKFDYSLTSLSRSEAADIFNTILECYKDYFFEEYGFNEALGNAVSVLSYKDYDYAEALDLFDDALSNLNSYVKELSSDDTTRFRSNVTGYSFADLTRAISSIREMDLDILSSYVSVNNVTKDKDRLVAYYEYRIENLTRQKAVYEEELATIKESIDSYQKDQIIVFSNGTEGMNSQFTEASEQYDKMISQRISVQTSLSNTTQRINYYNDRIRALKSKVVGSTDKIQKTEADIDALSQKITTLVDTVNKTADDYYENVSLSNAYNILVPASSEVVAAVKGGVKSAIVPAFIIEMLIFLGFFAVCLVNAIKEDAAAHNAAKAAAATVAAAETETKEEPETK